MNKNTSSTANRTDENDYLALDGRWYPSNKLEGYLAQKPKLDEIYNWLITEYYGPARRIKLPAVPKAPVSKVDSEST